MHQLPSCQRSRSPQPPAQPPAAAALHAALHAWGGQQEVWQGRSKQSGRGAAKGHIK